MAKFRVDGHIRLPVVLRLEASDMTEAASEASAQILELGERCHATLKDQAAVLAGDLSTPVASHVKAITRED